MQLINKSPYTFVMLLLINSYSDPSFLLLSLLQLLQRPGLWSLVIIQAIFFTGQGILTKSTLDYLAWNEYKT